MTNLATYSTADVHAYERIDYWDHALSSSFTGKTVEVADIVGFRGRFDLYSGGEASFANVVQGRSIVRHGRGHAMSSEPSINLHLQVFGESINVQDDQVARLRPGHFTLCDSEMPFEVRCEGDMGLFVYKMEKAKFLEICPSLNQVRCKEYDGTSGAGKIFTTFIHTLWREIALGMPSVQVEEMSSLAIALLGKSLNQPVAASGTVANFHSKDRDLREYIERNLGNRDLCPVMIADAFNISTRYLHKIFSTSSFTVNSYIRHRRLEAARMMLVDAAHYGLSITELALVNGFADSSQFATAFRAEYRMTPREYRNRAIM